MQCFECWAGLYSAVEKNAEERLCVEKSRELFSNIRARGGASLVMLASTRDEPLP